ncbi:NAD(P)/FAD-dependent oxidoreductase [Frankia sp. Cr1]|uniref:flavin monoamine oxidase family protein n=1 Tax=Frankia sp. Cr1 TaxID=3073931 RepID=UPI002AD43538|nr:NAD(P)/FAD-dependent oxidoreductase [Frankia sp. Cr1]
MSVTSQTDERSDHTSGEPKTITVLGAGVAGLVAAYELERRGHRVRILEGSNRIGGRVHTYRFGSAKGAQFAELGAMRIPISHTRALHYIAKLGLLNQVREFRTILSDDDDLLRVKDGGYVRVRDAPKALVSALDPGLTEHGYRYNTLLFGSWLNACLNAVAPEQFRDHPNVNVELLDLVDRIDLEPYLCGDSGSKVDLHSVFADHPYLRSVCSGRHERFLDDVLMETSNAIFRLRHGTDALTDGLAAKIRGPLLLGHEVVGLSVRDDGVVVGVRHGGMTSSWHCDYVLCTIPFPVLRRLRLDGFDDDKLSVIHETQYWPATKIAFHCREAFWTADGITGGASFTGGLVRQTYYPPVEGDRSLGAVLLASYTIGPDAEKISKLDPVTRHEAIVNEVSRMHPRLREPGMILATVSQVWGEHRWSRGAATIRWTQDAATCEEQRQAAARPQDRLFFAGEHCSSKPAWIEGAIESAIDAVHSIQWHEPFSGRRSAQRLRRVG